jgi:hypothetical protein
VYAPAADALPAALLALRAQAARACTSDAPAWAGHDPLLSPLLDAVVRSKADTARGKAWRLLDWLLSQPEGGAALRARVLTASTDADKRVRLGAALATRHMFETCGASDAESAPAPLLAAAVALPAACAALLCTVQRDGALHAGAPAPTRLTAAAADALLCVSAAACAAAASAPRADNAGAALELLWQLSPSLEGLAMAMAAWGAAPGAAAPLRSLALREAARHVSNVRAHGDQPGATLAPPPTLPTPADSDDDEEEAAAEARAASAAGLPPRTVACGALAACWAHYAPLMLSEPADGSVEALSGAAARWLSTLASACAAEAQGEVAPRRAEAAQLHALTCIALLAAAAEAHPEGGAAAVAAPGWATAPKALMDALRSHNERITTLAVASLRAVLLPSGGDSGDAAGGWGHRAQSALEAFLPLLEERDGVSRAGVALLGELVARQPGLSALRVVFDKLSAPSPDARRNALDALAEALARGAGQAPRAAAADATGDAVACDASSPQELLPEYAAALAERILPCLSDADLTARAGAAALLGRLSPSCVLPPLLALCGHREGRTRSAAAEALAAVLRHHAPPARALAALLACIVAPPAPTEHCAALPEHPGQIGTAAAASAVVPQAAPAVDVPPGRESGVERAIGVLRKWASADVTPSDAAPLADVLLDAMLAAPSDTALVRAAAALGALLGAPGGPGAHVLCRVRGQLAAQPPLSAEEASATGDASQHVFERLTPLLVLRVLPLAAFEDPLAEEALYGTLADGDDGSAAASNAPLCIAAALLLRMGDGREPDDVRRVSAELVGRLRADVAWPRLVARTLCCVDARRLRELRACLFAACAALAARGAAALPGAAPPPRALLAALTRVLTWQARESESGDDTEVMKTQLGVMDFLATLVAVQLDAPGAGAGVATLRIAELDGEGTDASAAVAGDDRCCADVLSALLALVTCASDTLPWCTGADADAVSPAALLSLRACCANALIAAGRAAEPRARVALARRTLPAVTRCALAGAT